MKISTEEKFIIGAVAITLFFLFAIAFTKVFAAGLPTQPNWNAMTTNAEEAKQTFTNFSGTFSDITFYGLALAPLSISPSDSCFENKTLTDTQDCTYSAGAHSQWRIDSYSTSSRDSDGNQYITLHWNTPITIPAASSSDTYWLYLNSGNVGRNFLVGGSKEDSYADGGFSWGTIANPDSFTTYPKDMVFVFSANGSQININGLAQVDLTWCEKNSTGSITSGLWSDLVCNTQYLFNWTFNQLFIPHKTSQDFLVSSTQAVESKFPFSIVFDVVNNVEANATSSVSESTTTLSLPIPGKPSANFLSPNLLANALGATTSDLYFKAMKAVIWIGTAWASIGFIL